MKIILLTILTVLAAAPAVAEQTINVVTYNLDFFQRLFLPNGGVPAMIVVTVMADEPRDMVDVDISYRETGTAALKSASMRCKAEPWKTSSGATIYQAACAFPFDAITGTVDAKAVGRNYGEVIASAGAENTHSASRWFFAIPDYGGAAKCLKGDMASKAVIFTNCEDLGK